MSSSDLIFTSNGRPASMIRCHIFHSGVLVIPKNLTHRISRSYGAGDLWTGKGTKREISDMFLSSLSVILSTLHLNFLPPPLTPNPHHKHTYILKQEVLDHINSHFQSPLFVQRSSVVEQLTCRPKTGIFTGRFQI